MDPLRRIVVGYNFSSDGDVALRTARTLAISSRADLYLLHVVEPYTIYQKLRFPTLPAEEMLAEVVRKTHSQIQTLAQSPELVGLHVETDACIGKPFVELIARCRTWQGDLIVVGVSPRGKDRFLGSTGERVLRKAPVPVLLAKQELHTGPETILIPTDFSLCAQQAAQEALVLAHSFDAQLIFVHVIDLRCLYPTTYGPEAAPWLTITPKDLAPDWDEFLQELPLQGVRWRKETLDGRPAPTIAEIASKVGAELIVMGTHGRTGLTHILLGSVAEEVTRVAPCSVLTIRPEAFQFTLP
jgi:universal stress protein E